jgi:uncharacterized lipoprotein YmbA
MRSIRSDQRARFSLLLLLVILTGCASSPPSKFYQLNPVQNQMASIADVPSSRNVVIAVGPVRIPDYLDRPQIVTRSGKNELKLSEFDRWAGSLEADISRVLVENISSFLAADGLSVVRWTPYPGSGAPASYQIEVLVDRFEGTLGDSVPLKAQWRVFASDGSLLLSKESRLKEPMSGSSYDALVAAMSSALGKLSLAIAEELVVVLRQAPAKRYPPEEGFHR